MKTYWGMFFVLLCLAAGVLSTCGKLQESPGIVPDMTPILIPSETKSTSLVSSTITVIPAEDLLPQPSLTLIPPLMPAQTYQSYIPLPTIAPNNVEEALSELQQSNGDCKLPCWWGISPGETQWDDASRFLKSLGAIVLPLQPDNTLFGITINNPIDRIGASISVDHKIVQSLTVNIYVDLVDILDKYGQPDEI